MEGFLNIDISQKSQDFIKSAAKYGKEIQPIYKSIETNLTKIKADLDSLAKNSHNLALDFGKFREKYATLTEKNSINSLSIEMGLTE